GVHDHAQVVGGRLAADLVGLDPPGVPAQRADVGLAYLDHVALVEPRLRRPPAAARSARISVRVSSAASRVDQQCSTTARPGSRTRPHAALTSTAARSRSSKPGRWPASTRPAVLANPAALVAVV